jgi:hypothetical protein
MIGPIFWIDTCAFVEAKNRWYRPTLAPKFWGILSKEVEAKNIGCPLQVYKELAIGNDYLATWIKSRKSQICYQETPDIQAQYTMIADYVDANYPRHQVEAFLADGDPWLIAIAMAKGGTVITGENLLKRGKIKIPAICKQFQVTYADIPEMLEYFGKPLSE